MKKAFLFLPILTLLFACNSQQSRGDDDSYKPGRPIGDDNYYALFMYNYPRVVDESAYGMGEMYDNALFYKEQIGIGELIAEPSEEPTRSKYEFQGWFKETECLNPWSFELDRAEGSTYLYAKWGVTQEEDYIEPEYVYPEKILDDSSAQNYIVTGILNKELRTATEVDLTLAAINRLKASPSDVSFAVNYQRKANVTLTTATFNESTMTIHLETSNSETFDIHVNDITSTLNLQNLFPTQKWVENFEGKANKYETAAYTDGNYHVALGGSSSMENWSTSTEDMNPIVTFNHGIGGTTVENWTTCLLERLITPYSPKLVAYYVGVNNIINDNKNGTETGQALVDLFDKTHQMLPEAKILYVLINKLPGYPSYQGDFDIANRYALEYAQAHDYVVCLDAGEGLLKPNGQPHHGYFSSDGLHMSKYGYVVWGGAVKKAIMQMLG